MSQALSPPPSGEPAAAASDRPDVDARGSWWGVVLVLLVSLGVVGGVVAVWWRSAPQPLGTLERYVPLASGVTLSYRVTEPSGRDSFQSSNVERLQGNNAVTQLDGPTMARVLALVAGGSPGDDLAAQLERARQADTAGVTLARVTDTDYGAGEAFTRTVTLLLLRPRSILALSIDEQAIDPPLPLLDVDASVGEPQMANGTIAGRVPYTATLTLEAREAVETPLGRQEDCLRVRLHWLFLQSDRYTLTWYCAGVGIARQESGDSAATGGTRSELIGASAPELVTSVDLGRPAVETGSALPRGVGHTGALTQSLPDAIETLWTYRDRVAGSHVTAPPLPADNLLIYGTQNGGLVALDRRTHQLKWRFQTGAAIYGAPAVAGGTVFVGSADRRLYALDLASGAFRWAFATHDAISAAPAVADGVVYVGSEDRNVYALDARTGQERWHATLGSAVVAAPTVAGDVVYVGSDDSAVYALDSASGEPRWAYVTGGAITAAPTVVDGVVYAGSHDNTLYALKADAQQPDGELLWSYEAEGPISSDLVAGADTVYLATDEWDLRAVDRQSGRERWRYHSSSKLSGAPLLVGDQLLINRVDNILAVDARTGAERGVTPTGDPASYTGLSSDGRELFVGRRSGFVQVLGSHGEQPWASPPLWEASDLRGQLQTFSDTFSTPPVLAGDRLIYVTTFGRVYSVATADGSYRLLGQLAKHDGIRVPPAVAGDDLYVMDARGVLIAFDLRGGGERWRTELGGTTWSAPSVADGRVLVSAGSEKIVTAAAFDVRNGRQIWKKQVDVPINIGSRSLLYDGRFLFTASALYAVDPASGEQLWVTTDQVLPVQFAVLDERVYGVGFDARGQVALAAWDIATGRRGLGRTIELPEILNLRSEPVIAAGRLMLTLVDGATIAFDTSSGAEVWRQAAADEPRGTPAIYKGVVLLMTKHNRLLARTLDDGRLIGEFTLPADTGIQDFSAMAPLVRDGRLYAAFYQTAFALELEERP